MDNEDCHVNSDLEVEGGWLKQGIAVSWQVAVPKPYTLRLPISCNSATHGLNVNLITVLFCNRHLNAREKRAQMYRCYIVKSSA